MTKRRPVPREELLYWIERNLREYVTPEKARRISRVAGYVGSQALGDFIVEGLYCATVARMAGADQLCLLYKDDRPYKNFLMACNPYATAAIGFPAEEPIPMDWFDIGNYPANAAPDWWYDRMMHVPDLVLTPSTLVNLAHLEHFAKLRIPPRRIDELAAGLKRAGTPETAWLVGLHIREQGYVYRQGMDDARNSDPLAFLPLIDRIIAEGGVVVRIGDPSMTPLPPRAGLVDLSQVPDSFELQAFAFSRARFTICSVSGPAVMSMAFGTPTLFHNHYNPNEGANPGDLVMLQTVIHDDGTPMPWQAVVDNGLTMFPLEMIIACRDLLPRYGINDPRLNVCRLEPHTMDEIVWATERMLEGTEDRCAPWPQFQDPKCEIVPSNSFSLPVATRPAKGRLYYRGELVTR
ncbi:MAG TPA: TIGR04372 family glycosyltransferase [Magnetospirillum sp.]|nr:TIGR04372 family glycosyltransferase [Magnetospirillum sp.]